MVFFALSSEILFHGRYLAAGHSNVLFVRQSVRRVEDEAALDHEVVQCLRIDGPWIYRFARRVVMCR